MDVCVLCINSNFKHSQTLAQTHCNGILEKLIRCTLLIKTTAIILRRRRVRWLFAAKFPSRYKLFQFISTVRTQMTGANGYIRVIDAPKARDTPSIWDTQANTMYSLMLNECGCVCVRVVDTKSE